MRSPLAVDATSRHQWQARLTLNTIARSCAVCGPRGCPTRSPASEVGASRPERSPPQPDYPDPRRSAPRWRRWRIPGRS
jgi:hypothetical protein